MDNQSSDPFLSKMAWNSSQKQDININMMPPRTTLVPVSQRRSSTLIDSHSPPMRSLKTELIDENSQNSMMDHMINENSVDSMRHRFRPISESSQDIMNENSNENSNFHCDKSNESTSCSPRDRMAEVPTLVQPEDQMPAPVVDLRLKPQITTINDLADTQPPSLATLLKFGVTEPTNMPLPTQTGQSVENFFMTTLENQVNKPVLSNSVANVKSETKMNINNKVEILNQLLNSEQNIQGTKLFNTQVMNPTNRTEAILPQEILPINESHIASNRHIVFPNSIKPQAEVLKNDIIINQLNNNLLPSTSPSEVMKTENIILSEQSLQALSTNLLSQNKTDPSLILSQPIPNMNQNDQILTQQLNNTLLVTTPQNDSLKTDTNLILTQQNLVVNLLPTATPKLDELVNSTVESHIGSPPQVIIPTQTEIRQSPILQSSELIINSSHPEVLLNTQVPMLSSTITPGNDLLIRSPQNEITHQDVILNPQVSPSVICQNTLLGNNLNTICQQNSLENCLQNNQITECISENNIIQNHIIKEIPPKIATEIASPMLNIFENNSAVITNMTENDLIHYIDPDCFEGTYTS